MEQHKKVNIHSIVKTSQINGPGNRSVIWFQGCELNCKGCFNQPIREIKESILLSVKQIINRLPLEDIQGVTISGGEPFLQPKGLYELAKEIKNRGLSLVIYTGYLLDDLIDKKCRTIKEILRLTDILIDGPFIDSYESNHPWTGSGNQKVYFLTNRYREYENMTYVDLGEVTITETGEILETGFIKII